MRNKIIIKLTLKFMARGFEEDEAIKFAEDFYKITVEGYKIEDMVTVDSLMLKLITEEDDSYIDDYLESVSAEAKEKENTYRIFVIATRDMESSPAELLKELGKSMDSRVRTTKENYDRLTEELDGEIDPIVEAACNLKMFEHDGKKFGISERTIQIVDEE